MAAPQFLPDYSPLTVYAWPSGQGQALAALAAQGLAVISVKTEPQAQRASARHAIRAALSKTLAAGYGISADSMQLDSQPGQPLRLNFSGGTDGLPAISLSHESGLSLAAICACGKIGVDLMRIDAALDWQPTAELYLSPDAVGQIARCPAAEQTGAFAHAWTAQEARLKCLGLALREWDAMLEHELSPCRVIELALPPGYCGTLALLA